MMRCLAPQRTWKTMAKLRQSAAKCRLSTESMKSLGQQTTPDSHDTALSMLGGSLDVRRFDTLVHAGPMDF